MSGTAFGTIVLHIAPEAAIGGPLALVEEGDLIELDVPNKRLELLVDERGISQAAGAACPFRSHTSKRGYGLLYTRHTLNRRTWVVILISFSRKQRSSVP